MTSYLLKDGEKIAIKFKHHSLKGFLYSLFHLKSSNPIIMTIHVANKQIYTQLDSSFVKRVFFHNTLQKKAGLKNNVPFQVDQTWPILEISPDKRTYFYSEDLIDGLYVTPSKRDAGKIRINIIGRAGHVSGDNLEV